MTTSQTQRWVAVMVALLLPLALTSCTGANHSGALAISAEGAITGWCQSADLGQTWRQIQASDFAFEMDNVILPNKSAQPTITNVELMGTHGTIRVTHVLFIPNGRVWAPPTDAECQQINSSHPSGTPS